MQTALAAPSFKEGPRWEDQPDFQSIPLSEHYRSSSLCLISPKFDSELFQGLLASSNFLHTFKTPYPVNHPHQKRANYLLLEKKQGRLIPTVLASYDYHQYKIGKRALSSSSCICFWMPGPKGETLYLLGELRLEDPDQATWNQIRLQIAFLNGDLPYLLNHAGELYFFTENHAAFLRKRVDQWVLERATLRKIKGQIRSRLPAKGPPTVACLSLIMGNPDPKIDDAALLLIRSLRKRLLPN